jgi:3-deoxy-D-manno-octulosonate 8-phosphate phosphatase (KDO 8-P phosphatase)
MQRDTHSTAAASQASPGSPAPRFSPQVLLRAQGRQLGIKAAIFDVDGVLTDGTLYIGENGESFKAFSVLDGQGLKLLRLGGIEPLVITGRDSQAVRRRLADLGVVHALYGAADKLAVAQPLLQGLGLSWADVAVIGDDWPDLPLLTRAAFAAAPPNAHGEVLAVVQHVTQARGGAGAAREFCDLLLQANGRYSALLRDQLGSLDGR